MTDLYGTTRGHNKRHVITNLSMFENSIYILIFCLHFLLLHHRTGRSSRLVKYISCWSKRRIHDSSYKVVCVEGVTSNAKDVSLDATQSQLLSKNKEW